MGTAVPKGGGRESGERQSGGRSSADPSAVIAAANPAAFFCKLHDEPHALDLHERIRELEDRVAKLNKGLADAGSQMRELAKAKNERIRELERQVRLLGGPRDEDLPALKRRRPGEPIRFLLTPPEPGLIGGDALKAVRARTRGTERTGMNGLGEMWLCRRCEVRSRPHEWGIVDLVTRSCPFCGEDSHVLPGGSP